MSSDVRRIMLSLDIDAKVKGATAGMDQVANSAADMARSVDESHDRLLKVADGADAVATNFSTLAGAAGDIAGGLDMVGLGQFSDELESVAPALMFVAGVADVTAVATNALSAANVKARATTIAKTISEKASAAATKAMAAAQWLLNTAMEANPIGLIIVAVIALVAAIVLAYKKSETFRNIVQAVGRVGAKAIGWVVDKVGDLVGWVKDKLPGAFSKAKTVATTAFRLITTPARVYIAVIRSVVSWVRDHVPAAFSKAKDLAVKAWQLITTPTRLYIKLAGTVVSWVRDKVGAAFGTAKDLAVRAWSLMTSPARTLIDRVGDLIGWVRDRLPGAFTKAKDTATDVLDAITAPIRALVGFVNDLVNAISHIHWPEPPGWVKDLGGKFGDLLGRTTTSSSGTTGTSQPTIVINVSGALDPEATARQISRLLAGRARLIGAPA